MDWYIVRDTIAIAAPAVSACLFVMSVIRYLRDSISGERRRMVRRSLIAFCIFVGSLTLPILFASHLYLIGGNTLAGASMIFGLVLGCVSLITNLFLGLKSGVPAGAMAAQAGLSMLTGIFAGDLAWVSILSSRVVQ